VYESYGNKVVQYLVSYLEGEGKFDFDAVIEEERRVL